MTTLLLERPLAVAHDFERDPHGQSDHAHVLARTGAHGRLTLDDLVTGVWEGLAVRATVTCPVCAGSMTSGSDGANADTPTGVCLSCDSRLS
jgi:DnaJ-class molecular chaperone